MVDKVVLVVTGVAAALAVAVTSLRGWWCELYHKEDHSHSHQG
jgi:hypothetical protein